MKIFNKKIENIKFITLKNKKFHSLFFKKFKFYINKKNFLSKFPHRLEFKYSTKINKFYENSIYKNKINNLFFSDNSKINYEGLHENSNSVSFASGVKKKNDFSLLSENKIVEESITKKVGAENRDVDRLIQANMWKIFSFNDDPPEISNNNNKKGLRENKNNRKPENLLNISNIKSKKSDFKLILLKINEILKDLDYLFGK